MKPKEKKKVPSLFDKDYKYVPASKTNVQETWRKNGWIPPQKGETK